MTLGTNSCFKRYFFKLQKEPKAQAEELAKKKSKLAKMKIWANLKIGFSIGLQVSTYLYKNSYFEFSKKMVSTSNYSVPLILGHSKHWYCLGHLCVPKMGCRI